MRTPILLGIAVTLLSASLGAQAPSAAAPPGNADSGKKLYLSHGCWTCHGTVAHGGGGSGPRLAGRVPAWPAFSKSVRRPADEMIPYTEKVLSNQELADIYAWLRSIPAPPPVSSIPQLKSGAPDGKRD
jgi:mono/diheme cytochrome c family protein